MAAIAFIGLGNMGGPMAANLVGAGHAVAGFDLDPAALDAARAAGVTAAASAAEAAAGADVVVTMLPAGQHLVAAYEGGLVAAAPEGALFIDSSTVDVASSRRAHAFAAARGMSTVDAPVSGGVAGAVAGTLTFMAGGAPEAVERARPILAALGRRVVACGGPGAGQAAKLCNNMVLGIAMVGISEAFVLAEKLGLDHQALFDVVSTSSGQCWALTNHCPVPGPVPASAANRAYAPGFAAALMLKDLTLARDAADSVGADTALGRHARDIFAAFAEGGGAALDYSAVIEAVRRG
ncbi:3-hydroxyisobutyrate dehydrogenase [Lichenibacterium minor]|jgi:3-hydroxyisobutyrate dehydrogenase|uniref:3-hydroxyisobutyrate dehydrogenase n=1 Tax=Lichenibacterium minor TaxID=2316528 RepID=A0A4V1RUP8_9HYPH|nr:3-hydroxyisobutyrate dehydrogenase [Lichenibacterium minor]RYC31904.1 3-hydroxyisobutyrate dehydrogenase [Lichenibacterium minor]